MLRPKKKISKRELKEDALVTSYVKATGWYEANKKLVGIGALVVAVLVVGSIAFINNRRSSNEKAMTELGMIYSYYDNTQYAVAIDGVPERNIAGLKSIVDNYGSTSAGELARFYLANCYFQLRRFDEALEAYDDFSPNSQLLTVSRLAGMAACHEAKGEHGEAASMFEKAAVTYANDVNAAENFSHAARNFAQAGNKERAIEVYKKIKKEFPKSAIAREVDRYIAQLSI
jgi:tetratricopeptide (TPR) repeat protein